MKNNKSFRIANRTTTFCWDEIGQYLLSGLQQIGICVPSGTSSFPVSFSVSFSAPYYYHPGYYYHPAYVPYDHHYQHHAPAHYPGLVFIGKFEGMFNTDRFWLNAHMLHTWLIVLSYQRAKVKPGFYYISDLATIPIGPFGT